MITKEELDKMHTARHLLPAPASEIVKRLLDEIDIIRRALRPLATCSISKENYKGHYVFTENEIKAAKTALDWKE